MNKTIIALSILNVNIFELDSVLKKAKKAKIDWLHFDMMDGYFVKNFSFSLNMMKQIKEKYDIFTDTHLMITNPEHHAVQFANAGSNLVTFHFEACTYSEITHLLNEYSYTKKRIGIVLNINTKISQIYEYLPRLDVVVLMGVEPGKGGQKFNEKVLNKIVKLKEYIQKNNLKTLIEIDGGIKIKEAKLCREAGADILVAGTFLTKSDNFSSDLLKLKGQ